jgi:hypothetical protein
MHRLHQELRTYPIALEIVARSLVETAEGKCCYVESPNWHALFHKRAFNFDYCPVVTIDFHSGSYILP